jgi:hypothetical protein
VGDEFPLRVEFEEDRFGISGEYMLAPRINRDADTHPSIADGPTWGDRFDTRDECYAGDCENPVSEAAMADGYPLCTDHDTDEARSLYDDRDEEDAD